ncbi:hypothetical protein F4861DRAFT_531093 [Xylaria intraflava]|nr:hypothetical protein F4861DRAFT_531093 [Xylaria intraflava]
MSGISVDSDPVTPSTIRAPEAPAGDAPPNTRRCFVCLTDEPENDPSIDWVTPCDCSLQGHHECLLAWLTDLEAQAKEFKCPVCKSPIVLTERYDPIVWLSNFLNHEFSLWSPRILVGCILAGAVVSSAAYGAKVISWFAGPDVLLAYLTRTEDRSAIGPASEHEPERSIDLLHYSTLPFIAPALIINRMNIVDMLTLPVSLVVCVSNCYSPDLYTWPPGPDRVFFAFYPILKATYFNLHKVVSDSLERSCAARTRSMTIEQGSQTTHAMAPLPGPAPAQNIMGLDIDIDIQVGENDDDDEPQNNGGQRNRAADVGSRSPIDFIAGALLYPGVCYGMGELMRRLLPPRFVNKPANGPVTGLLQQLWGRSFVGGCLFVVLKDAFFLYVKYKRMMNHPYRRVKNSDRRNLHK